LPTLRNSENEIIIKSKVTLLKSISLTAMI
jgi:hypothetical protein